MKGRRLSQKKRAWRKEAKETQKEKVREHKNMKEMNYEESIKRNSHKERHERSINK